MRGCGVARAVEAAGMAGTAGTVDGDGGALDAVKLSRQHELVRRIQSPKRTGTHSPGRAGHWQRKQWRERLDTCVAAAAAGRGRVARRKVATTSRQSRGPHFGCKLRVREFKVTCGPGLAHTIATRCADIRYCRRMSRKSYVNMWCVCMYVGSKSHPRTSPQTLAPLLHTGVYTSGGL